MEKLIDLLNKHRREKVKKQSWITQWHYNGYTFSLDNLKAQQAELLIISKQYWFIKRLVDNDKIDTDKIEEKSEYTFIKNGWWEHIIEDVLMLLSISNSPIEDLISYLK